MLFRILQKKIVYLYFSSLNKSCVKAALTRHIDFFVWIEPFVSSSGDPYKFRWIITSQAFNHTVFIVLCSFKAHKTY